MNPARNSPFCSTLEDYVQAGSRRHKGIAELTSAFEAEAMGKACADPGGGCEEAPPRRTEAASGPQPYLPEVDVPRITPVGVPDSAPDSGRKMKMLWLAFIPLGS